MNNFDSILALAVYQIQSYGLKSSVGEVVDGLKRLNPPEPATIKPKKQKPEWMTLNAPPPVV